MSFGQANSPICTTSMCDNGTASVQEMDAFFQALPAAMQPSYQATHDSIMAAYNQNVSWYTGLIPFEPACCTLASIGAQADALLKQMQQAAGQPTTPGATTGAGWNLSSILGLDLTQPANQAILLIGGLAAILVIIEVSKS